MYKNEIIDIITENAPESGADAKFISYGSLWEMCGGDSDHAPECVSILNDAIGTTGAKDDLFTVHDIAVQLDAVKEGVRGIRIMKVD